MSMWLFCRSPVCSKGITGHGVQRAPSCEAFVSDTDALWFTLVHTSILYLAGPHVAEGYLGFQVAPTLPNIPHTQGHCEHCAPCS